MNYLEKLRAIHGQPSERSQNKLIPTMTAEVMEHIQQSPFAVLSTANAAGQCDASPRGGLPGFVKVLNERTLLIPDIKGNRLFQSFSNIVENPHAALIFFVPGKDRTVRVNGNVKILIENDLKDFLQDFEVHNPDENTELIQALIMEVDEAYSHCPRALKFAELWG